MPARETQSLGIDYFLKRSTLSDANMRRSHEVFADIYYSLLKKYRTLLSDSYADTDRITDKLHIVDSSIVLLFSDVLKGVGRNPHSGKEKGGLNIHTLMQASEEVPCLMYLSAAAQNHLNFLCWNYL